MVEDGPAGTVVAFTVSQSGFTLTYDVRHRQDAVRREGTWTLDYTDESDLDHSIGFWRSVVEHSTHVALKTAMPGFFSCDR